ncbi:protein of unknown function DUF1488 [Dickeya chrysanthemi Ech1591]|uniref:DUF1488 domain-containing protein n=1 Tax=Dickeya chrysanthemi (strain Ech1591) TaxID=561229 RepID=C6CI06_DICC1|nr:MULTISPECIES: DUF1488 domain-containing protein [Dickeya]ACT05252.1 protein of unknown function DUF1488 [Dickeya chrysanthemi Ech1591]TYL40831.1 DUF1488 domain-containing protein [Dickeya sp. ws52]
MNQAIQFPEREWWSDHDEAIIFPVLVGGFQRECVIRRYILLERYGDVRPEQWLSLFREHRWDWEDEFERIIRDNEYDEQGRFLFSDGTH